MTLQYHDDLIFDVGMHIGQDTEFYLNKGFRVIAIEANPSLVEAGKEKFAKYIEARQLVIVNVGIGPGNESSIFYVNETLSEWSSFIKEIGERGGKFHTIQIQSVPIMNLFSEFGIPYYLKADIEGHDIYTVQCLASLEAKPRFVSVENGNGGLLECLQTAGYDKFKFINQANVDKMKCPFPPKEGLFVDHSFSVGSTGPFGEETIGEWKTYNEVSAEINDYWSNPNRDASIHGWFDLHAKLY